MTPRRTVCARLRVSVAKTLFLNDLARFFIRNEHQSKAQSHDLICIMTHRCDTYGHADFGLRIGDCGIESQEPPLNAQIILMVEAVTIKPNIFP